MCNRSKPASATRTSSALGATLLLLVASPEIIAAQNPFLTGVVSSAKGEAAAGALVRVTNQVLGLTYMVVSQAQGRYKTPNLPPGKYSAQSIGGGLQSEPVESVEIKPDRPQTLDLVLNSPQSRNPPDKKFTTADWAKAMPDGDGKKILLSRCSLCHGMERMVQKRATREEWERIVNRMRDNLRDHGVALTDDERAVLLDYFSREFSPEIPPFRRQPAPPRTPNGLLPRAFLKGVEAKFVAMEFDVKLPPGTWIMDLAVDSAGIVWVTERVSGMLGRFDSKTLAYTRIAPPPGKSSERSLSSVTVDSEDHVWFTDNGPSGLLIEYDPKQNNFVTYPIPVPPHLGPALVQLRFLDGNVWGTGLQASQIVRMNRETGMWTQFPISKGSLPYGLAVGGDKNLWYASNYDNQVVRLKPGTGELTRFKVPTPKSELRRMQADVDGNLWTVGSGSGKLVGVEYRSGKVTEYSPPTENSGPFAVDVDRKRNFIWFGEMSARKLGRFDPRSKTFAEFPVPSADVGGEFSDPRVIWIRVDPENPNRVWWAGGTTPHPKIGYIEVLE